MKVLFLPEYPDREFYTIIPIFMRLGWFATQDPKDQFDFGMSWQDSTWVDADPVLLEAARAKPVLNLECRDISKRRVEGEFAEVFGRTTFVDPQTFQGRAVCKYDENARGGRIVELPLTAPEADRVYQKFVDSTAGDLMLEFRVPFILDDIPVVYEERKDIPLDTIKTRKQSVRLREPSDVFDDAELDDLRRFCKRMRLDFGELDVVRSNADGMLYVLDVNKTPGGFGIFNRVNWEPAQRLEAIERLSQSFKAGIERILGTPA
jgi:hypothetical protein